MNNAYDSSVGAPKLDKQQYSISSFFSRLAISVRTNDLWIAFGLLLLCFITRLPAIPASLWEWDDILFARALHKYDLIAHSPHPPGFPVFVVMSRIAYWFLRDEHQALTAVVVIFSTLLAPALFYFYREVFHDRRIAFAGALIGSFVPNVWVHSGAARSDEVSLVIGVIGLALVIHGLKSPRSLIAGCALFGLGMGVRTTLLPVMGPAIAMVFLIWLWRRNWRLVAIALATGTICVLAWYIPFILKVTWRVYRWVMDIHSKFILDHDTIVAKTENGVLSYRFSRFFADVWGTGWIMWTIYTLSALGLFVLAYKRRWQVIGWMALSFLPFMIFTLALNTPLSAPLYSLPYIPLFTGLAACGLLSWPDLMPKVGHRRLLENLGVALAIGLTIGMAEWIYPILTLIHHQESPPIRAINYLKTKIDPQQDTIYFSGLLHPHINLYLPQVKAIQLDQDENPETNLINPIISRGRIYSLTTDPVLDGSSTGFHWTINQRGKRRLQRLSLGRYFDAYVTELTGKQRMFFLSGWYPEEHSQNESWRWMSQQAKVALFNPADSMILHLRGSAPAGAADSHPTAIIRLNDAEIDRFKMDGNEVDRTIPVKTDPQVVWHILTIEVDRVVNLSKAGISGDTRDLGFRCNSLQWYPAPNAKFVTPDAKQFLGSGWYSLETNPPDFWRWTEQRATAFLPAIEGDGHLAIIMSVPQQPDGTLANITVEVAGQVIEKFSPETDSFIKTYRIPASLHHAQRTELVLSADKPVIFGPGDNRHVGMQVVQLVWRPGA